MRNDYADNSYSCVWVEKNLERIYSGFFIIGIIGLNVFKYIKFRKEKKALNKKNN